jgi:hypothetical protein
MSDYNGWTNKETWLVNVWLGDYLAECAEDGQIVNADFIREMVEELAAEVDAGQAGLIADFIGTCLGEVSYFELAQHYEPVERGE